MIAVRAAAVDPALPLSLDNVLLMRQGGPAGAAACGVQGLGEL
jgi:hypothetical protein